MPMYVRVPRHGFPSFGMETNDSVSFHQGKSEESVRLCDEQAKSLDVQGLDVQGR